MNLRTKVTHVGQEYVDEAVYAYPKGNAEIVVSVAVAFGSRPPQPILLRHERVILKWMKPSADGLVPR